MTARSFFTTSLEGDALAKVLVETRRAVGSQASGGLVFVSGMPARQPAAIAAIVRDTWKGVPVVVVPAAGVLHERGEVERTSAASGLLWKGGRAEAFGVPSDPPELADALRATLERGGTGSEGARSSNARTVLLFSRPDAMQLESLEGLASYAPDVCLFGAGTVGGDALAVTSAGQIVQGRAVGLTIAGLSAPLVESSPAVRLISPFTPIEEAADGMILRLAGRPALEVLSSSASALRPPGGQAAPQPIVFAAVADVTPDDEGRERFVVRNVRGIDPGRRGVLIGPEARVGARCAFAVLDAAEARADLERAARRVSEAARGSAPRFAVYLSCAGRGQGLYGTAEVESRLLRQRFGDLPIAGMHSAFEIAPWGAGRAKMQFFTGVLALFRSPS